LSSLFVYVGKHNDFGTSLGQRESGFFADASSRLCAQISGMSM
jgi:hypothetical protein